MGDRFFIGTVWQQSSNGEDFIAALPHEEGKCSGRGERERRNRRPNANQDERERELFLARRVARRVDPRAASCLRRVRTGRRREQCRQIRVVCTRTQRIQWSNEDLMIYDSMKELYSYMYSVQYVVLTSMSSNGDFGENYILEKEESDDALKLPPPASWQHSSGTCDCTSCQLVFCPLVYVRSG